MTDTRRSSLPIDDSRYLAELSRRVLIYDGAMGTNIQRHNLTPEDFGGKALEGCNDNLVLTRPDVIQGIHESFLAVGCDVVETCTFQSTPRRLEEWGLGDKVRDINVGPLPTALKDQIADGINRSLADVGQMPLNVQRVGFRTGCFAVIGTTP